MQKPAVRSTTSLNRICVNLRYRGSWSIPLCMRDEVQVDLDLQQMVYLGYPPTLLETEQTLAISAERFHHKWYTSNYDPN